MRANDQQIGGTHYKGERVEHWDFVLMHDMPYIEAQVFKYVLRWKKKNGLDDLRKARHYLEKLIEWEVARVQPVVDVSSGTLPPDNAELVRVRKAMETAEGTDKYLDEGNKYMNPDSGVPRAKGYVDQD